LNEYNQCIYLVLVDDVRVDKEYIYFRARKIFKWSNNNVKWQAWELRRLGCPFLFSNK